MTDPADLSTRIEQVRADLDAANQARELALPGCRAVIRHCGSSIKAVHRLQFDRAADLANRHGFTARAQRARELAKQQR